MRCSQGWTGCREDHGDVGPFKPRFESPLPPMKPRLKPPEGHCERCDFYRKAGPHRLERWRFAALKRLRKARICRGTSFTPVQVAAMLAGMVGEPVPECPGEAWAFLKASYDPAVTPPSKECRRNDRRKI